MSKEAIETLFFMLVSGCLVVSIWPKAAGDLSRLLHLHSRALPRFYAGIRTGFSDYFEYMGWKRREVQTSLNFADYPHDITKGMRMAEQSCHGNMDATKLNTIIKP